MSPFFWNLMWSGRGWAEGKDSPLAGFPGGLGPVPDQRPAPVGSCSSSYCLCHCNLSGPQFPYVWGGCGITMKPGPFVELETGLLCPPQGLWVLRPWGTWVFWGPESGLTRAVCRGVSSRRLGREPPQPVWWRFRVQGSIA